MSGPNSKNSKNSTENSRIWREKAIARGNCPRCGRMKREKDLDYFNCFECRKKKAEELRIKREMENVNGRQAKAC